MNRVIRRVILPWQVLIFLICTFFLTALIIIAAWGIVARNTVVATDVACVSESIHAKERSVVMEINCGGIKDETYSAEFILEYLKNPKPFTCSLYKLGDATCTLND